MDKNIKDELQRKIDLEIIDDNDLELINQYNARLEGNELPIIYDKNHIKKIFNINKREQSEFFGKYRYKQYRKFSIPKKSGNWRKIQAPSERLLLIQRWIKEKILDKYNTSPNCTGFKKGSSILINAKFHENCSYLINMDIQDFFPSVYITKVYNIFLYLGYNSEVSMNLAKLCTNTKDVLPQGAPTSPTLANLSCLKLDKRLTKLSEKMNFNYSRYADDISISGNESILQLQKLFKKIIKEEGFNLNYNKYRIRKDGQRKEVTGLIVNNGIKIPRKYKKELEKEIYFCKQYGVADHLDRINCDKAHYKEHLYGKAYFIKMVEPEKGLYYIEQLNSIIWPY